MLLALASVVLTLGRGPPAEGPAWANMATATGGTGMQAPQYLAGPPTTPTRQWPGTAVSQGHKHESQRN